MATVASAAAPARAAAPGPAAAPARSEPAVAVNRAARVACRAGAAPAPWAEAPRPAWAGLERTSITSQAAAAAPSTRARGALSVRWRRSSWQDSPCSSVADRVADDTIGSAAASPSGAAVSARAARGDARGGAFPAGVERGAWLVEVDDHGRVVGRDRLALARLAIDLGPHHAFGDWLRDQQVIDAHAVVLVEHAGAVIPPAVALALGVQPAIRVDEAPREKVRERLTLGRRDMRAAVAARGIPDVGVLRRDVVIAAHDQRLVRPARLDQPLPH